MRFPRTSESPGDLTLPGFFFGSSAGAQTPAESFNTSGDDVEADKQDHHHRSRTADDIHRVDTRDTGNQNQTAAKRGSLTAEGTGKGRENTEGRNRHTEFSGMRRHSFVERKGSGVTGTGNQAEKERADRTAELSDRLRVLQQGRRPHRQPSDRMQRHRPR